MVFKCKGQTALEYLLIVVVAIVVVVAVMVWMNATTGTSVGTASEGANTALCRAVSCYTPTDCYNEETCNLFHDVECVGVESVGGQPIPGYCEPSGGLGGAIVCDESTLSLVDCSNFGFYGGGTLSCTGTGRAFDVSECQYPQHMFRWLYDEAHIETYNWPPYWVYEASGDVLCTPGPGNDPLRTACSANPASCIGRRIEITGGTDAPMGMYTIQDFLKLYTNGVFNSYVFSCPVLGPDFIDDGEANIDWTFKLYGDSLSRTIIPECGNGIVEPEVGEVCDGANLDGKGCASIGRGYGGGNLACSPDCLDWDTSGCWYLEGTATGARNPSRGECSYYSGDILCSITPLGCAVPFQGKRLVFLDGPAEGQIYDIAVRPRVWGVTDVCRCQRPGDTDGTEFILDGEDLCSGGCDGVKCDTYADSTFRVID
jgi:hypothetical protein